MFEENNIDKMMKSILEGAQEEVPAHIWEGVSAGLDKAARRKTVALWWRRAGIATAAAAAIALIFVLAPRGGSDPAPASADEGMIAVVEKIREKTADAPETILMAEVKAEEIAKPETPATARPATAAKAKEIAQTPAVEEVQVQTGTEVKAEDETEAETTEKVTAVKKTETAKTSHQDIDWGEEEDSYKDRKVKSSLVLSGITGTNSAQSRQRSSIMKRPTAIMGPGRTGISETSTNSTYGIPLSFGAGVKFDFTPKWSLSVGANYSLLSRKFYGTYTKVDENGVAESSTSSDIRNTQHYVGIPVNAYYNIVDSKNVNFYAYLGGTVEKCVTDRYELINTSIVHKEVPEGVQLSANAGIGVEFLLGRHLGLYIDPSLRYYFDNGQPKSIRTAQPLMFGFEMGLRVRL